MNMNTKFLTPPKAAGIGRKPLPAQGSNLQVTQAKRGDGLPGSLDRPGIIPGKFSLAEAEKVYYLAGKNSGIYQGKTDWKQEERVEGLTDEAINALVSISDQDLWKLYCKAVMRQATEEAREKRANELKAKFKDGAATLRARLEGMAGPTSRNPDDAQKPNPVDPKQINIPKQVSPTILAEIEAAIRRTVDGVYRGQPETLDEEARKKVEDLNETDPSTGPRLTQGFNHGNTAIPKEVSSKFLAEIYKAAVYGTGIYNGEPGPPITQAKYEEVESASEPPRDGWGYSNSKGESLANQSLHRGEDTIPDAVASEDLEEQEERAKKNRGINPSDDENKH